MVLAYALGLSAGDTLLAILLGAVVFAIVVVVCAVLLALMHTLLPGAQAPGVPEDVHPGEDPGTAPAD